MVKALPRGPFDIIVADPPWRDSFGATSNRTTLKHYETMQNAELASLQLPVGPNALLFLWALPHMLPQALTLVEAWGFSYRTSGAWIKDGALGKGKWLRNGHEPFLVCRRGTFPCRPMPGIIRAPRGVHSQKPEALQDNIEDAYPEFNYLELFARRTRTRWVTWGNEV